MHTTALRLLVATLALLLAGAAAATTTADLAPQLQVGDIVFIRVPARPFREVADATGSWTNHVGIIVEVDGTEPQVAESTFPFARTGGLSAFTARSESGRVAVARMAAPWTDEQRAALRDAVRRRDGTLYDTGFDLHSRRLFCSRYVREVVLESTGTALGEVETFATLLSRRPDANLGFWRLWYFGRIPWQRETVTPASVLASPALNTVFDGVLSPAPREASRAPAP